MLMRAKMRVDNVTKHGDPATQESLSLSAVTGETQYGPNGENEDNTYSRYTPYASLQMNVTNPALFGKLKQGDKLYVDFTIAEQ